MARIRSIKPEFWTDEKIAGLPLEARLLFIGLWSFADDEGRMRANPILVRSQVFPYDPAVEVERLLGILAEDSLITPYRVGDQSYLVIRNWKKHQRIDKPTKSQLPPPPDHSPSPPRGLQESSATPPGGKGEEGKGEERKGDTALSGLSPTARGPEPLVLVQVEPGREAKAVFDHWVRVRKKPSSTIFSDERKRKLLKALKHFSVEQLCRAIDGVANDPWDGRAQQDDIVQVLRDAGHVEKFLALAAAPPLPRSIGPPQRQGAHVPARANAPPETPGRKFLLNPGGKT